MGIWQQKESYRLYSYDSVFNAGASQREVYESIGYPIVNDVLNGVNGTLMAYGQVCCPFLSLNGY